jgi:hypothetical protein
VLCVLCVCVCVCVCVCERERRERGTFLTSRLYLCVGSCLSICPILTCRSCSTCRRRYLSIPVFGLVRLDLSIVVSLGRSLCFVVRRSRSVSLCRETWSIGRSVCPSVAQSADLSICLSFCQSVHSSICPSIFDLLILDLVDLLIYCSVGSVLILSASFILFPPL